MVADNSRFLQESERPINIPNNQITDLFITMTVNHALFYYKSRINGSDWNLAVIRPQWTSTTELIKSSQNQYNTNYY